MFTILRRAESFSMVPLLPVWLAVVRRLGGPMCGASGRTVNPLSIGSFPSNLETLKAAAGRRLGPCAGRSSLILFDRAVLLLLFVFTLVSGASAGSVTIFNHVAADSFYITSAATNVVQVAAGASGELPLPAGVGLELASQGGGIIASNLDGSLSYVVSVGSSQVGVAAAAQAGAEYWTWFASGMGIGLMFYGFGWSMRIIRNIGRVGDI